MGHMQAEGGFCALGCVPPLHFTPSDTLHLQRFTPSDTSHTFLTHPTSAIHPMQAVTVDTDTAVLVRSLRSGELTLVQEPQVQKGL